MTDLDRFQNFAVSNRAGHRLLVAFIVASLLAAPAMRAAIQYRRLKSFGYPDLVGANPSAPLIQGSDGALYGTTEGGGRDNLGTVFKVNKDGSGYSALYSFNSTAGDGQDPVGGLVEGSDGALYGTTALGGNTNAGTVFKLNKDGSGYLVLHSFSGLDGRLPVARLIEGSNGTLYGTSYQGGSNNVGTVFELNKDGTSYSTLHSFSSTEWDGRNPQGGLMEASDGALYGTTASGGKSSAGTVFKLNQDGSGYGTMLNFSAPSGVGQYPADPLLEGSDGALYGTTIYGGNANAGTVFKLNKDGSGYDLLHDFGISHSGDGLNPVGGLVEGSDGALYGTTYQGGGFGPGTVFKLNKDGSDYSILHSFSTADNDGRYPQYGLVEGSDGALYGTTYGGGSNNAGTVFKMNKDGTDYSVLHRFSLTGGDGWAPQAGLVEGSDRALYGTTYSGGSNNSGTVFKLNEDGTDYSVLRSFGSSGGDGRYPYAGLVEGNDGALYGTTYGGGSNNLGTVFKLNKDGIGYSVLYNFSITGGDGHNPQAALAMGRDGAFYGTTRNGGDLGFGTVFRLLVNSPPVAVARAFPLTTLSPDDTNGFVISLNNADATVYFDGSRSSDVENDPLRFFWFEDSSTSPFVTGVVATSVLPVGSHVIVLIVSDGMDTGTNRIVVEVVTAGQAVEKLIDIVNDSAVSHKDTHPLIVTLNAASASFNRGNPMAGLNQLATFQSKVLARVSPDDPALAQALSQAAQKIIDAFASLGDRPRSVHLERRNHF